LGQDRKEDSGRYKEEEKSDVTNKAKRKFLLPQGQMFVH
jgi:hypothetical protein